MSFLDLSTVLGGLALFLHGLTLARDGLQGLAADRLRGIVTSVTRNRLFGVLSGASVTAILQSSTATTVMLVGFAGSGVLTLGQAVAVLLGADVGTTLTVQLLSFRVSQWGLLVAFVGFAIRFVARRRRVRFLGQSVLGFGLLFVGLKLTADGASPLAGQSAFDAAVLAFHDNPVLGVLASAAMTVLLQGSAASLGLLLSLAHGAGGAATHLTLGAALPMVLGANLGSTVTPILSSVGQEPEGKRVALAHLTFKALGVAIFLPALPLFEQAVAVSASDLARQIANAHTLFNVFMALLLLPFTRLAARAITWAYRPKPKARFGPRYLDPGAIESPALAFGLATREFLRMCDLVGEMLRDCFKVIAKDDLELAERVEAQDDKVDILNREIRFYLARLGAEHMTPEQADRQLTLINLTADMENAGDTVNRGILSMARKKIQHGLQFSQEGLQDLALFHRMVVENFDLSVAAFSTGDEELARKVLRHRTNLKGVETQLKQKHIARLHQGLQESLDTSSIHLDLFSYLRRVNMLVSDLAEAVMALHARRATT